MGEEILWPPKEESDDPEIETSTLAKQKQPQLDQSVPCLLYTSDAADE